MKQLIIFLMFFMIVPVVFGITIDYDISISSNDIVTEDIKVTFMANQSYDSFSFTCFSEPLSVLYDGDYTIQNIDDSYVITFNEMIFPGQNELHFSLLFDDLVEKTGSNRVFRTGFSSDLSDDMYVTLSLPSGFVLSEKAPQATPVPQNIFTDGQHIKLRWHFTEDSVIAVFYKGPKGYASVAIFGLVIIIVVSICLFLYFKRCFKKTISETLSKDEQLVVEELRKGLKMQKLIARNLGFSKSKMSKVIRKLEEKGLIEKIPHFKTNKIKLKKIR